MAFRWLARAMAFSGRAIQCVSGVGGARAICTWLEQFDADVRLSSERILLDGTETREAAAFLSVNEARATLDLAELMVFDGLVNGQFNARWHEDAFRLSGKGNASGVELGALLARLGGHSLASGPADVSFTMQGAGNSLDGLWRNARVSGRLMALQGGELAAGCRGAGGSGSRATPAGRCATGRHADDPRARRL